MDVAFSSIPYGSIFRSKISNMLYIKVKEGEDFCIDLDVYKVERGHMNAICITKELAGRVAVIPGHTIVELID